MTVKDKYILEIRSFLRDYKEKNQLLMGEFETEDSAIGTAIDAVYRHAVNEPPIVLRNISLETMINFLWFKYGVVAYILDSVVFENLRNALPYQDGGVQIDENYKAGPFQLLAKQYQDKFDVELQKFKIKYNYSSFNWGGTSDSYPYGYYGGGAGYRPIR